MPTYYIDPVNGNDANDGLGWWKIAYSGGTTAAPAPGATITGAGGATAQIDHVVLSSGTWAGNNAAGTFYLYNRNGTAFANGENITWTGGSCTNAQGTPYNAVYASFKTIKKTFAAGDTINAAKSVETAATGTVTATTGSVSVATTNDLTTPCPQYTVIRIGGDDTLYMVKAVSSSVITLYRPYRGATASGKGLTYYTGMPNSASDDWKPTSAPGTAANPITLQAGMNPADNTQDGFTVLYGNNANFCLDGTFTFVNLSRVATLYWHYPWAGIMVDCIVTNCFAFRTTSTFAYSSNAWTRCTVNGLVSELGFFPREVIWYYCTLNNIETSEPATYGWAQTREAHGTVVSSWKNTGYSSYYALALGANCNDFRFVDPNLDELASGCHDIYISAGCLLKDTVLQNPILGSGTVFGMAAVFFTGEVRLSNVGGSATDHRTYVGLPINQKWALLTYENTIAHTSPPSVKVALYQAPLPAPIRYYIPCDAGVQKTVSVWLRKNSSYGSVTRPTMRLRWMTGTAPNLVSNVHDEVMADTDDTFLQQSYTVTPSVAGVVIMELLFQSANSGAIAYYDDIGVA